MKNKILFLISVFFLTITVSQSQIQSYYSDVDLTKTGMDLKDELANKIINTHTTYLSYSDLWNVLKQTDEAPSDNTKVMLVYGWENGTDGDCHNDLLRDKDDNGGSSSACDWNREHVFPRSLGNPTLDTNEAYADAHHVRASDVSLNGQRGNKKFAAGSGHSATVGSNYWYPGDEWKGDVARMIMYMYLRYDTQCLPRYVGVGNAPANDPDMIDLFLQWNAEDPPSAIEDQRNNLLESIQGNRNPFIDNPYLATVIWSGPVAQDRWNMSITDNELLRNIHLYPNPVEDILFLDFKEKVDRVQILNIYGQIIREKNNPGLHEEWNLEEIPNEVLILIITSGNKHAVQKIIKK